MSKLTDTLKAVIEPLRYLIGRNSERIDRIEANPASVQSDMAQSDPKAPDYIKNRIVYDDRKRTLIFEGDVKTYRYAGSSYASDDLDFVLKEDALYEVEFGDNLYIKRCTHLDGRYIQVLLLGSPFHELRHNVNQTDSSVLGDYMSEPIHLKVSLVDESVGYKTLPKHLVPDYNLASELSAGVVKVSEVARGINESYVLPIVLDAAEGKGFIYAMNPLPAAPQEDKLYVRWDFNNWRWVADAYPWAKSTNGNHYKLMFENTTPVFKNENDSTIWTPGTFMPEATASDSGKIPMVQEDGSWGLGEVPSGGGSAGSGGSGEKYIIEATFDGNGDQVFSWRDPVEFSTFANAISNGKWPDVMVISIYDGIVAGVTIPTGIMFADPELSGIVFVTWDYQILFSNDGSLKRTYGG